jgi:transcriptional regulator with XRE-family HTH domain
MTKEEKKKKFDRKAYMRDYRKKYNQTDDGRKKKKQEINANYQKSEKGKETRKKNGWLKNPESVQKRLLKSIGRPTNGKRRKKRTTERIAILTRQGYAGAIKALRSDLGLTQTQASEKTGVPVATIRQTERGAVYLSEERLKEYTNKLGYKDDIVYKIVKFKYPVSVVRAHVEEELANYGIGSHEADEELLRSLIEKKCKKKLTKIVDLRVIAQEVTKTI